MKAWHFVGKTLRDGTPIPADGVKLVHTGPLVCCESGFHASLHPFDALRYAPGETLCLVDSTGKTIQQNDKLVSRERTIISRIDATFLLRYFARQQALSVIHLWKPPQVVLDYLAGDDSKRKAAWAAGAAQEVAGAAAQEAAWAAGAAAGAAAWIAAAWAAAGAAAAGAAAAGAAAAARAAQKNEFDTLVREQFADFLGGK